MAALNNNFLTLVFFLVVTYIFASIPYGFILVKTIKHEDIREFGSGNIGATNVARCLGLGWGVFTFLLDFLKGFIPVYWISVWSEGFEPQASSYLSLATALLCIVAHNHSIFIRFKGGKGVSTSIGVITALSIANSVLRLPLFLAIGMWIAVFLIFRIVAIASLTAALLFFLSCVFLHLEGEFILLSFLIFAFMVFRHRSNIEKLRRRNV